MEYSKRSFRWTPMASGFRFLAVENENSVPFDLLMSLGLHSIWRCRTAVRHADLDTKPAWEYFYESLGYVVEVGSFVKMSGSGYPQWKNW